MGLAESEGTIEEWGKEDEPVPSAEPYSNLMITVPQRSVFIERRK